MCLAGEAELLLNFPHTGLALSTAFHHGMLTARLLILLFVSLASWLLVFCVLAPSPQLGGYFTRVLIGVVVAAVNTG